MSRNARADTPVHIYMVSQNMQMLDVEEGQVVPSAGLLLFTWASIGRVLFYLYFQEAFTSIDDII